MKEVSIVKQIGAIAIIAGTAVGAGMLGIPLAVAAVGLNCAVLLLFLVWTVMFASAMLIVEASISQPLGADMDSISYNLLGIFGRILNLIFYLFLLYAVLTAYIWIGGQHFQIYISKLCGATNSSIAQTIFCVMFGFCIFKGVRVVFKVNELVLSLKVLAFILFIICVAPDIQIPLLERKILNLEYAWSAIPILVTSFAFHIVVPSIRNYIQNDRVFKRTIVLGSLTPLLVYVIWVVVTLGTVSLYGENGFINLNIKNQTLAQAYISLGQTWSSFFINLFEIFAIITSFLGVALALFSFNKDVYKIDTSKKTKRFLVLLITLVPPLVFAIYYVKSFMVALGYASIFIAILLVIQPSLMVWKLRNLESRNSLRSKLYLSIILFSGVAIILLQLLVVFGKLRYI